MEAVAGLVGVILGFLLSEISSLCKERMKIASYKRAITAELQSLKGQIPQIKDICRQALTELGKQSFLPPLGVPAVTQAYDNFGAKVQKHLSPLERNCLHIIYGRLKVCDKVLAELENDFRLALAEKVIDDPFLAFSDKIKDIYGSYDIVLSLIDSYLNNNPIDVFKLQAAS